MDIDQLVNSLSEEEMRLFLHSLLVAIERNEDVKAVIREWADPNENWMR